MGEWTLSPPPTAQHTHHHYTHTPDASLLDLSEWHAGNILKLGDLGISKVLGSTSELAHTVVIADLTLDAWSALH